MIIEIPNENSIIKWKNDAKDEWKYAELSDLIQAYERPQGDLVSREALKDFAYINKGNFNTVEGIREWIDNAPTVEPCYQTTSCLDCKNYDKENHNCPRFCEVIRSALEERPQGDIFTNEIVAGKCPIEAGGNCPLKSPSEWIAREDMDYIDENKVVHKHFECKECGLIHDFIDGHTSQYNFCPQCGARMQNGGAV